MRLFIMVLCVGALAIIGWYFFSFSKQSGIELAHPPQQSTQTTTSPSKIDYSAGFAIFTNGTFRIFTQSMYHNLSQDVYIESSNPNMVHVKKAGITWDDFFKTLPMKLTKDCLTTGTGQIFCTQANQSLKFYLNGKKDPGVLDRIIDSGDQLLVSFGSESDEQIEKQFEQIPNAQ